jgi:hypothetical protein
MTSYTYKRLRVQLGTVLDITDLNYRDYGYSLADATDAYKRSGLYDVHEWTDTGYWTIINHSTCTATGLGSKVIMTDQWDWLDPNYYYFSVIATDDES